MNNFENDIENTPDSQQEDESDIGIINMYRNAVIISSNLTIKTINSKIKRGNIDLQPELHEKFAWNITRISKLIESIVVGIPLPNIVIAENEIPKYRFMIELKIPKPPYSLRILAGQNPASAFGYI